MMWSHRAGAGVLAGLAALGIGCSDGTEVPTEELGPNPMFIQVNVSDKTAFVSTFADVEAGATQTNADGFEVTAFAYSFVREREIITTQNLSADVVFRFTVGEDGKLREGGQLTAPAGSYPSNVVWASDEKAYLSLAEAGEILVINPTTMELKGTIDLNDAAFVPPGTEAADVNPNPSSMVIRDGKLFVALWQTKAVFVPYVTETYVAVIDTATDAVEKVITDDRGLVAAGRPGEPDAMVVDEKGDLYVYAGGGFSLDPSLHHGFLRIKKGQTDFDPDYFYDLSDETVDVPSGHSDFCNSMRYWKNGLMYCTLDDFSLYSNPPDYLNDFALVPAQIDLYARKTTVLPMPYTNGTAGGAMEIDGDKLIVSLATKSKGLGLFTYDLVNKAASDGPEVEPEGYAGVIRRIRGAP